MDLVTLALAKKYTNEKVAESGGGSGTSAGFGIPTATATQLESTEQPTISVVASGPDTAKVFDFSFGIPAGKDGANGTSAGFGTPTATIDNTTGTPSVQITASGPDTAKVFSFAFSGLKGEPGESTSNTNLEPLIGTTETITPAQAMEAIQQGRQVVIVSTSSKATYSSWIIAENLPISSLSVYSNRAIIISLIGQTENDENKWVEFQTFGQGFTPSVSEADAGKYLRVNSEGKWVAEYMSNAEGGSF